MADPKVPPHDSVVEKSLLGAILINKDAMIDVAEFLRSHFFYEEANSAIYEAMMMLYEAHEPIDVVTVAARLKKNGTLKIVGGATYVNDLLNAVPTSAHAEHYGRIVQEHFIKRKLIEAAAKITDFAFRDQGGAREIVDRAEQEIFAIAQTATRRDFIPVKDALAASFDR